MSATINRVPYVHNDAFFLSYLLVNEIAGTITILEFNYETKRIRGMFTFSYTVGSSDDVYQVTARAFDYPIDQEAID